MMISWGADERMLTITDVDTPHPYARDAMSSHYVIRADLLAREQINGLLRGEKTRVPDAKQLWFVPIKGVFYFPGPPSQSEQVASPPACHIGYEGFDPDTGNWYLFGGLA